MGEGTVEDYLRGEAADLVATAQALGRPEVQAGLTQLCETVVRCLRAGGTLVLAGNGGSAADAEHLAAEFVGRCTTERGPLRALALTAPSATVTAIANDYGYETVFARQVEALVTAGDVLLLMSTSGASPNVVRAAHAGRARGATVVALVGAGSSDLAQAADLAVHAPSTSTQRIQEMHTFFGHVLAGWVDRELS